MPPKMFKVYLKIKIHLKKVFYKYDQKQPPQQNQRLNLPSNLKFKNRLFKARRVSNNYNKIVL
jgi:hypothetical protein